MPNQNRERRSAEESLTLSAAKNSKAILQHFAATGLSFDEADFNKQTEAGELLRTAKQFRSAPESGQPTSVPLVTRARCSKANPVAAKC